MTSENDDDENFITYGEPLEDEEDEPTKNPTAVENQVVKDAQGRRRFHGAFTGGFSAGYFNSVGSKEGWTPSNFVSSRSSRTDRQHQRAEDFMDEEDLGEYGIAPRSVQTADQFCSAKRQPKRTAEDGASAIPGPAPLDDLVTMTNSSIGTEILRKMGWREGQGIGPKVRKYKKKHRKKLDDGAGILIAPLDSSEMSENREDLMQDFLFGPSDVQEFLFQMKSDQKGLGYSGISQDTAILGGTFNAFGASRPIKGKRKGIEGSAFGIGAFEDRDDEVYSRDDMDMYDTVLGGEEPSGNNFGWTAPKSSASSKGSLDGFTPAVKTKTVTNKVFSPPALPHGFRPAHVFADSEAPKGEERYSRFSLSSEQRSALLGEEVLPGKPVPLKDHSKALAIPSSGEPLSSEQKRRSRFSTATGGRAGTEMELHKDSKTDGRGEEGITEWERQRSELTRTSSLNKPMSAMIASRFVSAQYKDEEVVEFGEVNKVDKSHHENAADIKMYGKLTRESYEWYPDHIVCKRFNVPHPYPGSSFVGVPGLQKEKVSFHNFMTATGGFEDPPRPPVMKDPPPVTSGEVVNDNRRVPVPGETGEKKRSRWDLKPAILSIIEDRRKTASSEDKTEEEQDEEEGSTEETEDRPPMDLFNAIFNESESSDSDDSEDEEKQEAKPETGGTDQPMESHDGYSPGDEQKVEADSVSPIQRLLDAAREVHGPSEESGDDQLYGPALPPPQSDRLVRPANILGSVSATSVPASRSSDRESRTVHRKHKKHHHSSRSRSRRHRSESRKRDKKDKKQKKHSKESHRERTKSKHKKRPHESDSSYTSASEG